MSKQFRLASWSRLILGSLLYSGVKEIVVSPGSRSTPLLAAALATEGLVLWSVVDERSAAFFGLGRARTLKAPVALLCTSGTAAANYLPAVIEADYSGAPLVVLTADRPSELYDCGASQTVDQVRLYGAHVRRYLELGAPPDDPERLRTVSRSVAAAVAVASRPRPGPVHLNVRADKPLEPCAPNRPKDIRYDEEVRALLRRVRPAIPGDACAPTREAVDALLELLAGEPRGIIACGYDPQTATPNPEDLAAFAQGTGYPVLLDAAFSLRMDATAALRSHVVNAHDALLRSAGWWSEHAPRIAIQVGRPLTSSAWERYLARADGPRLVALGHDDWPDPSGRATVIQSRCPGRLLAAAAARLPSVADGGETAWSQQWLRAGAVAASVTCPCPPERHGLGELEAVGTVLASLPAGSRLVLGNSLPIRELDLLGSPVDAGVRVIAQRGASGKGKHPVDAAGCAARQASPTVVLLGDVSFLHDVGGLWAARAVDSPLAIVVVNNGGGRIFEQLPVADVFDARALEYLTTPQDFDLSGAAKLYGVGHRRVTEVSALREALGAALATPGPRIIEIEVAPDSTALDTQLRLRCVTDALVQAQLISEPG